MKSKMNQMFEDQKNDHVHIHVLYKYNGIENYIMQVLSYIQDGIAAGDYVILIENARLYPMIHKELSTRLTKEQMEFIHHVNSLDFYWSSGSYHPPSIADYFSKTIQPYMEKPLHLIEDLEKIVDEAVNLLSFPLICAYDRKKMPDYLKTILMETHPYVLMEDDFIVSEQYQPSNVVKKHA
ncbi:MEDS domain-containing protein [Paenisporosarcina sp. TG-14]|uniref:MEDS domain-containing protein n=1 Tax=Paenisporosarcina sp. TG-14 TaxID=1231057 RepID=UPI0002EFF23A|nr:MEDS domain-containing protein [Paenisporosarcina sp. TG-14]